jgi:hypothetical protein
MTTLRAPKATKRLLGWTFRRGNRLLSCQVHEHGGFFTVATVPHWDVDQPSIECYDRGIDAFSQHASLAARLRQLGWELVSYNGSSPRPRPGVEIIPAAA